MFCIYHVYVLPCPFFCYRAFCIRWDSPEIRYYSCTGVNRFFRYRLPLCIYYRQSPAYYYAGQCKSIGILVLLNNPILLFMYRLLGNSGLSGYFCLLIQLQRISFSVFPDNSGNIRFPSCSMFFGNMEWTALSDNLAQLKKSQRTGITRKPE